MQPQHPSQTQTAAPQPIPEDHDEKATFGREGKAVRVITLYCRLLFHVRPSQSKPHAACDAADG